MPKVIITTVHADAEPEEFDIPEGFLPEFVHELAKTRERTYRHKHFKTAIEILGLEEHEEPVKEFIKEQSIQQVSLTLLEGCPNIPVLQTQDSASGLAASKKEDSNV